MNRWFRALLFAWISLCWVPVQALDLLIPDMTLGTHVAVDGSVCVQVPIFLDNTTAQPILFGQANIDLDLGQPNLVITGGTGQVLITRAFSQGTSIVGLADPPADLRPFITGFSHACAAVINPEMEQTLADEDPRIFFPIPTTVGPTGISANIGTRQVYVLANASGTLEVPANERILFAMLQIPIEGVQAGQSLSLQAPAADNLYIDAAFSEFPFGRLTGPEPNASFELTFCEPATVAATGFSAEEIIRLCPAQTVSLEVTVTGQAVTAYQWRKDGVPVSGQTGAVLSVTQGAESGGRYDCLVTTACGTYVSARRTVAAEAVQTAISEQPVTVTACAGDDAGFQVSVASTGAPTYQWFFNDEQLPGQTNAALSLAGIDETNVGTYYCVVNDGCGSLTSNNAQLSLAPLSATVFPRVQALGLGDVVIVGVAGCPGEGPTFAWINQSSQLQVGSAENLSLGPETLDETTSFEFSVLNAGTQEVARATALVLVSDNVLLVDPNQDQTNSIEDLWRVAADLGGTVLELDADGDDQITVLDLLYVNTGPQVAR